VLIDKIAIAFISPLGTGLAAGSLAFVLMALRWRRSGIVVALLGFSWILLWSLPVVSFWLVDKVESDYLPRVLDALPKSEAIVILGGGMTLSGLAHQYGQPVNLGEAADRVWLGARLYHLGKAPLVVMSGGSLRRDESRSEAEAMSLFATDLSVPESAMVLETLSRNTRENARFTALLLKSRGITSIFLVTSAAHMGRASHHFMEEGLDVTPVPTDFTAPSLADKYCCLPDTRALDASGRAFKELVGQIVSR
jgi:uncharacterized SAM-binding protein YcdF (DUF218 family)